MKKLNRAFTTAVDGMEAVEAFKANPGRFTCILMDINMPRLDGLKATQQIRSYERDLGAEKACPIFALTGLAQVLKVPYRLLYPAILVFCCIGVYSINNTSFDVYVTVAFSVFGYLFYKLKCEPAPLILGFILGPLMEENLRRAMLLSRGDPMTFITKPISAGFIVASVILLVIVALPALRKKREEVFVEEPK